MFLRFLLTSLRMDRAKMRMHRPRHEALSASSPGGERVHVLRGGWWSLDRLRTNGRIMCADRAARG